jgi:hypothetical protein
MIESFCKRKAAWISPTHNPDEVFGSRNTYLVDFEDGERAHADLSAFKLFGREDKDVEDFIPGMIAKELCRLRFVWLKRWPGRNARQIIFCSHVLFPST